MVGSWTDWDLTGSGKQPSGRCVSHFQGNQRQTLMISWISDRDLPGKHIQHAASAGFQCKDKQGDDRMTDQRTSEPENSPAESKSVVRELDLEASGTVIESWDHAMLHGLEKVRFSDRLAEIGDFAFFQCTSLKGLSFPRSVRKIGSGAFKACTSLKAIELPAQMTEMGSAAFAGCSSLETVTLPPRLRSIPMCAFQDCGSLRTVNIAEGTVEIGAFAFNGCSSLKTVTLPRSVRIVGMDAFARCTSLQCVIVPSGSAAERQCLGMGLPCAASPGGRPKIEQNSPRVHFLNTIRTEMRDCHNAAIVRLTGGMGRFHAVCTKKFDPQVALCLNGQGIGAMNLGCPSCTAELLRCQNQGNIVAAQVDAVQDMLNAPFQGLEEAVNRLSPLIGLFSSGYYLIADWEMLPSECGKSFWESDNGVYEFRYGYSHTPIDCPNYLLPSQTAETIHPGQVNMYMRSFSSDEKHYPRTIAYYLRHATSVILDGHHKATAAWAMGHKIPTILIIPLKLMDGQDAGVLERESLTLRHSFYYSTLTADRADFPLSLKRLMKKRTVQYIHENKEGLPLCLSDGTVAAQAIPMYNLPVSDFGHGTGFSDVCRLTGPGQAPGFNPVPSLHAFRMTDHVQADGDCPTVRSITKDDLDALERMRGADLFKTLQAMANTCALYPEKIEPWVIETVLSRARKLGIEPSMDIVFARGSDR
ncbi:MAG: leucine-rich repeat protein [Clostridia bacterium]|nr:leucine-rich repeat protein [Clostridia bacterium]